MPISSTTSSREEGEDTSALRRAHCSLCSLQLSRRRAAPLPDLEYHCLPRARAPYTASSPGLVVGERAFRLCHRHFCSFCSFILLPHTPRPGYPGLPGARADCEVPQPYLTPTALQHCEPSDRSCTQWSHLHWAVVPARTGRTSELGSQYHWFSIYMMILSSARKTRGE